MLVQRDKNRVDYCVTQSAKRVTQVWALCVGKTVHKVSNTSLGLSVENRRRMEEEQVIGDRATAKNIMEARISVKSRACSGTLNVVRVSMRLVAAFALLNALQKPKT